MSQPPATKTVALSTWQRLSIYLLFGPCIEVAFTGIWEFCETRSWRLHGLTSIWVFGIYGLSGLVIESLFLKLKDRQPIYVRGILYLIWSYSWEFSTGYILRLFDACPWDYEPYFYGHFMGLITLEYAPLWYISCMLGEYFVVEPILRLRLEVPVNKAD